MSDSPSHATVREHALRLLASGKPVSRADLVELLGVAPSTVSTVVRRLLDEGVILEEGVGRSTGGRRPRFLRLRDATGVVAVAELGSAHARIGVSSADGGLLAVEEVAVDIAAGPAQVLDTMAAEFGRVRAAAAPGQALLGVGVALPGPVSSLGGRVVGPARMPGWNGYDAQAGLRERFDVPVVVDNDAMAAAVGEHAARGGDTGDTIYVKAGTGIGGALIAGGRLYRGERGLSGDITHSRVAEGGEHTCSCGNRGCLETVASGAALTRQLRERGLPVHSTGDIIAASIDADPTVVAMVRNAGRLLGVALSGLVNFLNPDAVVIGGALSSLDVYVAAARGMLYERCLPSMTQTLTIEASRAGRDAALLGLVHLIHASAEVRKVPEETP